MQKALKQPLQPVNFQNFILGACFRIPQSFFLFLNQLQNYSAEKKYAQNFVEIMPPLKFLATPLL